MTVPNAHAKIVRGVCATDRLRAVLREKKMCKWNAGLDMGSS